MPSWVVPTVAAEVWGVSLAEVLRRAGDGTVASRTENGFTFVDLCPSNQAPLVKKPETFSLVASVVTEAEWDALHGPADQNAVATMRTARLSLEKAHFKDGRVAIGRLRVAPKRAA